MAKKAGTTKAAGNEAGAKLHAALKFISAAQNAAGAAWTRHCVWYDGFIYSHNGVLTCGHPVEAQMQAAPHTAKLIAALERCGEHVTLTHIDAGVRVQSGKLRATIECFPLNDMPQMWADPPIAPLDDEKLRAAMAACGPVATEGAQQALQAAVCFDANVMRATNRHVAIEYWHGIDMPTLSVPKTAVRAVEAVPKKLTQFGFTPNSLTFYFEDGSWLKTQLYTETFPSFEKIFNHKTMQWKVPDGFFDALRNLQPFVQENSQVYLSKDRIHTHVDPELGSSFMCDGLPSGLSFNLKYLLLMEGFAKTIDFGNGKRADGIAVGRAPAARPLIFFGDNVRGALAGMHTTEEDTPHVTRTTIQAPPDMRPVNYPPVRFDDMDDDIPF